MRRRLSSILITLFLLSLLTSGDQSAAASGTERSGGKLNLSFQPYAGKGHEKMPVEVLKVTVQVGVGVMWVHEWRMKNLSDKEVVQIRPALFVYSESKPDTLLLRHQVISTLGVGSIAPNEVWPGGKCSGNYCPNAFGMISARELLKPLFPNGEPEGDFIIALGIDKVWFADGTVWELAAAKDN